MDERKPVSQRNVTLGFAGDFCLADAARQGSGYVDAISAFCRELTELADWSMANLEFSVAVDDTYSDRKMVVPARYCARLQDTGFAAFCLANNHILDGGALALSSLLERLDDENTGYVGAGRNLHEARACLSAVVNGVRIGVLAATDATHYDATGTSPGVAGLSRSWLLAAVSAAKQAHDIVIVNLHADVEFTNLPAPWRVELSRLLAQRGADIIVQHHPHTLQGIEYIDGTLVAYSLGNFVFPVAGTEYMRDRPGRAQEGAFLLVDVELQGGCKPRIRHRVKPIVIDADNLSRVVRQPLAEDIARRLDEYSKQLADPGKLRARYLGRCGRDMKHYLASVYYALARDGMRRAASVAAHPFKSMQTRNWIRGVLTFGKK